MTWLILDTESCGVTGQIDVISDIHVEVSRAKWIGGLTRLKSARFRKNFCSGSFLEYLLKKAKILWWLIYENLWLPLTAHMHVTFSP
jgi:hypothetical protein